LPEISPSLSREAVALEIKQVLLKVKTDLDQGNLERARLTLTSALNWLESYFGAYVDMSFALQLKEIGERFFRESQYSDALRCLLMAGRIADRFVEPGNPESMKVLYLVEACLAQLPDNSVFLYSRVPKTKEISGLARRTRSNIDAGEAAEARAQAACERKSAEGRLVDGQEQQSATFSSRQMDFDKTRNRLNAVQPEEEAPEVRSDRALAHNNDWEDSKLPYLSMLLAIWLAFVGLWALSQQGLGRQAGTALSFDDLNEESVLSLNPDQGTITLKSWTRPPVTIPMTGTTSGWTWLYWLSATVSRPILAQTYPDAIFLEDQSAFYAPAAGEPVVRRAMKSFLRELAESYAQSKSYVPAAKNGRAFNYLNPFLHRRKEQINFLVQNSGEKNQWRTIGCDEILYESRPEEANRYPGAITCLVFREESRRRTYRIAQLSGLDRFGKELMGGNGLSLLNYRLVDGQETPSGEKKRNILEQYFFRKPRLILVEPCHLPFLALKSKLIAASIFLVSLGLGVASLLFSRRFRGLWRFAFHSFALTLISFCIFGALGLFLP
jgi:hypothetical protein